MTAAPDSAALFARLAEAVGPAPLPPAFPRSEIFIWLKAKQLIVDAPDTDRLACAICRGSHLIERLPDGGLQIVCTEGPEPVAVELTKRWQAGWLKLCREINAAISPGTSLRVLMPSKLAYVGWAGKASTGFPVWLARGFSDPKLVSPLLNALEAVNTHKRGVVIAASQLPSSLRLPDGLSSRWLGDCFHPERREDAFDTEALLVAGHGRRALPPTGRRGRPKKPGDPLKEFLARVRSGSARKRIGAEAKAIHEIEARQFGSDAYAQTTIENIISPAFDAWRDKGFPADLNWS